MVTFSNSSQRDWKDIEHYICVELHNPDAAKRILQGIVKVFDRISIFPMLYALVQTDTLADLNVRVAHFENYNIFYHYDEENQIVTILRILNERVNWENKLLS